MCIYCNEPINIGQWVIPLLDTNNNIVYACSRYCRDRYQATRLVPENAINDA